MKNKIVFIFFYLFFTSVSAQKKGISTLSTNNQQLSTKTFAVVVGISDYQDPALPDLRFADKDAEAFANFLRSPSGGLLDADHLKLFLNDQATAAQIAAALDWLMEVANENDRVIIYFSGHGDVERKTISQPGYLLCWDSPSKIYLGGGTLALPMFQDIITTLSLQTKAKVFVIMDACHSGKLSGNSVGGSQITGANLAKQYANEIKILSSQPNEYSIEGEQWGGGRGAFSYHLVNALWGFADNNNDLVVTLQEAGRYLEDHVTAEVAPISQVPMIMGNRAEPLFAVDAGLLSILKSDKTNQIVMSSIDSRGLEQEVLATVDTTLREMYQKFKNALKAKQFLTPELACAETYYDRLIDEPKLERLHSTMRRNYAAALQDDAQQVMNLWLSTNISELILSKKAQLEKYKAYPGYLERATQLLGVNNYMYPTLQSRKHFFDGYLLALSNRNPNRELGEKILNQYRQALSWQPDQPHVYWQMSWVFANNFLQPDSTKAYALHASELAASWELPYIDLAYLYSEKWSQFDQTEFYLKQANLIDSNNVSVINGWGIFYEKQKKHKEAELQFKKAIQLDSNFVWAYNNLGALYQMNRFSEAELVFKKAIQLDSTYATPYINLGFVYLQTSRFKEAEIQYKKAIQLDLTNVAAYNNLGYVYFQTDHYEEAERQFVKVIQLDSTNISAYYNLACIQSIQNKLDKAFEYLEQSLKNGLTTFDDMQKDPDLSHARERTQNWKALMEKYFPEKIKN
jgi:Flp pilus assembly protein TadD